MCGVACIQNNPTGTSGSTCERPLRNAGVDLLEERGRRRRGGDGGFGSGEAEAEEKLFVLLVELQDLQDARAGVFEEIAFGGGLGLARGDGAQRGERLIEAREEIAFAIYELLGERALVLAEEAVFLERALMQFVTEQLVLLQGLGWRHGWRRSEQQEGAVARWSNQKAA